MPFTVIWGTGFETGSTEQIASGDRSRAYVIEAASHSGTYGLHLDASYSSNHGLAKFPVTGTPSELYVSAWIYPDSTYALYFEVYIDSEHYVGVRYNGTYWDAYVDGVKVDDGAVTHAVQTWHLVQFHVVIDNSGTIETRIGGIDDISYSGDTQPGETTAIEKVRVFQYVAGVNYIDSYVDDLVFGSDDWPGDIRFAAALVPDSDTAQKDWTPSAGSLNYDLVDDVPPNDSEYISAGSVNYKDLYGLSDWSPSGSEEPQFIVDWMRAKKDVAEPCNIESLVKSGSTESSSGSISIDTDWTYYSTVIDEDPDTSAEWTESGINALQIGQNRL